MSKGPGVDTSVASRVEDAGYDAPLPSETPVSRARGILVAV